MSNQLTGIIKTIMPTVQVSEKFSKREFVITDNSNSDYPQYICFQFTKDKCEVLDGFDLGEEVEVSFNLRGREWTSPQGEVKYFNTLEAWKIKSLVESKPQAEVQQAVVTNNSAGTMGGKDDLPF